MPPRGAGSGDPADHVENGRIGPLDMVEMSTQLRSLLLAEGERARIAVDGETCAISRWDRVHDVLDVLANVGRLGGGYDRFPDDESYPLDSFPAVAALIRHGRPYLDPGDVSSAALTAQMGYSSHLAVPIVVDGECWGELWVCRYVGRPRFEQADIRRLQLVADRLGDALAPHV
jgi:GAF domain-containing protein